ncbi:pirin family protein [Rhodoblastus sp.]|uniref:pirin family protein n=1 Tax=Rhodoblastus sp. TaxID=1962975 RepID=UPI003F9A8279
MSVLTPASVDVVVVPQARDIGGFGVRRALPAAQKRMVGPFVFLDEMGPADLAAGAGMDVRPHPHIGLATLTYLLEGEIFHRDSLGSAQNITPGAVNLMVAGRGIVHSERSPPDFRATGGRMAGLQCWLGLPLAAEETDPSFDHFPRESLPMLDGDGFSLRLAIGSLHGLRSPVKSFSPCFFADVDLSAGATYVLTAEHEERAFYLVSGEIEIAGVLFEPGRLVVVRPDAEVALRAVAKSRLVALGGDILEGPRFVWWNFVSSSRERIRAARADWESGKFSAIEGDPEFIPAPELKAL